MISFSKHRKNEGELVNLYQLWKHSKSCFCLFSFASFTSFLFISSVPECFAQPRMIAEEFQSRSLIGFPHLKGTLKSLLGHEGGYSRPEKGQSIGINLETITSVDSLRFGDEENSYIPLPSRLSVESILYYPNGKFRSLKLSSRGARGNRISIDVVPKPGRGKNRVDVWVLIENEVVQGVALIECVVIGNFPSKEI